jgi:glycogen operon protein
VEGPTDDPEVDELRARQQRNFIATLLLSQGVPMICHGDELGRSQGGNNNGFCQDNEITWIDWDQADGTLLDFTRVVSALRRNHPVFRRRRFFSGRPVRQRSSQPLPDIGWFQPDGSLMDDADWDSGFGKSIAVYLNGQGIPDLDNRGQRVTDDSFMLFFNAHYEPIEFTMPPSEFGASWEPVVDTSDPVRIVGAKPIDAAEPVTLDGRSVLVLRAVPLKNPAEP